LNIREITVVYEDSTRIQSKKEYRFSKEVRQERLRTYPTASVELFDAYQYTLFMSAYTKAYKNKWKEVNGR